MDKTYVINKDDAEARDKERRGGVKLLVDTDVYSPEVGEEVEANLAEAANEWQPTSKAALMEAEFEQNRIAYKKRYSTFYDLVKGAFSEEKLARFADALAMSGLDPKVVNDRVLAKLYHVVTLYTEDAPWDEIVRYTDKRGLHIRIWNSTNKRPVPDINTPIRRRAPRKTDTPLYNEPMYGHTPEFENACRRMLATAYRLDERSRLPTADIDERMELAKPLFGIKCHDYAPFVQAVQDTFEKAWRTFAPDNGVCLMPLSWLASLYFCSLPYEQNMDMLRATGAMIRENLRLPETGAVSNERLEHMPVNKKFRDNFLLCDEGQPTTEHGFEKKGYEIWEHMVNCFVFSLIGKNTDKHTRVAQWISKLLAIGKFDAQARQAFGDYTSNGKYAAFVRTRSNDKPRSVIFTAAGCGKATAAVQMALRYFIERPRSTKLADSQASTVAHLMKYQLSTLQSTTDLNALLKNGVLYSPNWVW